MHHPHHRVNGFIRYHRVNVYQRTSVHLFQTWEALTFGQCGDDIEKYNIHIIESINIVGGLWEVSVEMIKQVQDPCHTSRVNRYRSPINILFHKPGRKQAYGERTYTHAPKNGITKGDDNHRLKAYAPRGKLLAAWPEICAVATLLTPVFLVPEEGTGSESR